MDSSRTMLWALIAVTMAIWGVTPSSAQDKVDFQKAIRPIFEKTCIECHGPEKQKAKLRLDSKETAFKNDVIIPGKAAESLLYKLVTLPPGDDDIMPPKGEPLTKAQTDLIRDWINQGADWPEDVQLVATEPAPAAETPAKDAPPADSIAETAAELRATASELRKTAERLESRAASLEGRTPQDAPAVKAPAPKAPARTKPVRAEIKPGSEELKAIEALEKSGFRVRPIAANTEWREVSFQLRGDEVNDDTIKPLKGILTLSGLNLAQTKISDAGLEVISGLTNLTHLNLSNSGITDAGLAHLKGMIHLTYLNLYGTSVSDAGLDHLRGLVSLDKLYLWQTKATAAGAKKLEEALPGLEISLGIEAAPETAENAGKKGEES